MSDGFALVDRGDDGTPKGLRWLDPREVSILLGADGSTHAYLWDPPKEPDPAWRLDPLLIDCPCRHCRAGRMCKGQADTFRKCARADGQMIDSLRRRMEDT